MDPAASRIVTDILSDRSARTTTFGLDSVLSTRRPSAVKTGTSKDMRDNWCVGYTDRYTVGVWVGNSSGAAMWDVSGTTGAAPVWQAIVDHLGARDRVVTIPTADTATIVRRAIRYDRDLEAPREEWFLPGTEDVRIRPGTSAKTATSDQRHTGAIVMPIDGTLIAIDPDIPAGRQTVPFRAEGEPRQIAWRINGRTVGRGGAIDWPVWPGRHLVELVDAGGSVVDSIHFDVRGASVTRRASR